MRKRQRPPSKTPRRANWSPSSSTTISRWTSSRTTGSAWATRSAASTRSRTERTPANIYERPPDAERRFGPIAGGKETHREEGNGTGRVPCGDAPCGRGGSQGASGQGVHREERIPGAVDLRGAGVPSGDRQGVPRHRALEARLPGAECRRVGAGESGRDEKPDLHDVQRE